jgi:hypothetical protein
MREQVRAWASDGHTDEPGRARARPVVGWYAPAMAAKLKVELQGGFEYTIALSDNADPQSELEQFKLGRGVFGPEWIEAEGGTLIRKSAIVSAKVDRDQER